MYSQLRQNLITAGLKNKVNDLHVRILTDADGHKTAQKLYHKYVSDADYSKLPAFVQQLDRLLARFGAGKNNGDDKRQQDEDIDPPPRARN